MAGKNKNTKLQNKKSIAKPVSQTIKYYLNDPTTPTLTDSITFNPSTLFNVNGYTSPNQDFATAGGMASNVNGLLNYAMLNVYNAYAANKIANWSKVKTLQVYPNAGQMPNAYYDRNSLRFFWFTGNSGSKIFTCLSADIVTHELGHAILDYNRPDFWSVGNMEIWAFHEAFGDIFAFLVAIHHDKIVTFMLNETAGNLYESNVVSKIAEQFGNGLGMAGYLRNVDNDLLYTDPTKLPSSSNNPNQLTNEPHDFSRVMSGVIYRIFAEIYTSKGKNLASLTLARNFVRDTLFKSLKLVPSTPKFFSAFAKVFVDTGKTINPECANIANNVFIARNFLAATAKMQFNENKQKKKVREEKENHLTMMKYEHHVKVDDILEIKDPKHKELKIKLSVDDLVDDVMGFAGNLNSDMDESIECGQKAAQYIIGNDLIDKTWRVDDNGLLHRIMIRCDGFVNNCLIPGQPEYGKCWKYRISGCGCGGPYGCPEIKKVDTQVKNYCSPNYIIKCAETRANACQGGSIKTS